ncbi:MAG: di-heme oxidoredictase family protein [Bacteroidia bacterium]
MKYTWSFALILFVFTACQPDEVPVMTPPEVYAGGENYTTFSFSENAFGIQADNISGEDQDFFVVGNSLFRRNWVTAPSSVASMDGLGPVFNSLSCGGCHFKDGRAEPPLAGGQPLNGLLFRLSIPGQGMHGEPLPEPVYGGQLQDNAILGVDAEAEVAIVWEEIAGTYPDGSGYTLRNPIFSFKNLHYGPMASDVLVSPRIAPQVPGLGLLEQISEADILAFSDEFDSNSDGISGRANYVWDAQHQQKVIGRFGWKANQPSLYQQTAGAFNGDIGITTNLFPEDHFTPAQEAQFPGLINGGEPELDDARLEKVVRYMQLLAVPARRDWDDEQVKKGEMLFVQLGCNSCHRPSYITNSEGDIEARKNQQIYPYTDLLLHDMGPDLADGRPDFEASGSEWRTPPLWGIGLIPTVNDHSSLLHDGRARSIEEAILWHGGEAAASREAFKALSASERKAVVDFVGSL